MVLVDSSVWIDYLSVEASPIDSTLERLLRPHNRTVITGIIFQEVLQGIKNDRPFHLTAKLLQEIPFLQPDPKTHLKAAGLFKQWTSKGKRISSIDTLIAALAIEHRVPLFTLDTDFHWIEKNSELRLFKDER